MCKLSGGQIISRTVHAVLDATWCILHYHMLSAVHAAEELSPEGMHASTMHAIQHACSAVTHCCLQDEELIVFFNDNCSKLGIQDPVDAVRVVRDSASQLGKGFGFVQFSDQAAARAALGCDGQLLRKRAIRVTKAVKVPAHLKDMGRAKPGKKLLGRDASERKSPAGRFWTHRLLYACKLLPGWVSR